MWALRLGSAVFTKVQQSDTKRPLFSRNVGKIGAGAGAGAEQKQEQEQQEHSRLDCAALLIHHSFVLPGNANRFQR